MPEPVRDTCQRQRRAGARLEVFDGYGFRVAARPARGNGGRRGEHDAEEDHERNEWKDSRSARSRPAAHPLGASFVGATCRPTAGQREDREAEREQRGMQRLLQPEEQRAGTRDREPVRADDLRGARPRIVDEVVRVALSRQPAVLLRDHAMQDANAEHRVAVEHASPTSGSCPPRTSTRSPRLRSAPCSRPRRPRSASRRRAPPARREARPADHARGPRRPWGL